MWPPVGRPICEICGHNSSHVELHVNFIWIPERGAYIGSVNERNMTRTRSRRKRRQPDELMVRVQERKRSTVAFQWQDGAGEVHYSELTEAQSWPYLKN